MRVVRAVLTDIAEEYLKGLSWKDVKFRKKGAGEHLGAGMFFTYKPDFGIGSLLTRDQKKQTSIFLRPKTRHLHIWLHPDLQRLGLASKMIMAFVAKYGPAAIASGRVINPDVFKAVNKIKKDSSFNIKKANKFGEIWIEKQ